jgi:hypothetical protein
LFDNREGWMSAEDNKRLMQEIFAKVANGDGSLFVAREYQDSALCERVLGAYAGKRNA